MNKQSLRVNHEAKHHGSVDIVESHKKNLDIADKPHMIIERQSPDR